MFENGKLEKNFMGSQLMSGTVYTVCFGKKDNQWYLQKWDFGDDREEYLLQGDGARNGDSYTYVNASDECGRLECELSYLRQTCCHFIINAEVENEVQELRVETLPIGQMKWICM